MNLKNTLIIVSLVICILFSSSFVSANDVNDTLTTDNSGANDEICSISCELNDLENINEEDTLASNPKTFTQLNNSINGNTDNEIYLDSGYTFDMGSDDGFKEGVVINRTVTIHGNGFIIDGGGAAHIFTVTNSSVAFHDIVFVNAFSESPGGAIYGKCTAVNCTFINNTARFGGAFYYGSAVNCTFINNSAKHQAGALQGGNAINCTFINNTAEFAGATCYSSAVNCIFINNSAFRGGAFTENKATNCTFINNSAQIGGAVSGSTVVNSTFINNTALNYFGGAIADCNALDCTFINNSASEGGAVYEGYAKNCTFTGNVALGNGGAVIDAVVSDCLFEFNRADNGGAISGGRVKNSKFYNNSAAKFGGAVYNAEIYQNLEFKNNSAETGNDTYKVTVSGNKSNLTFSDLNASINNNTDSSVYLYQNYTFDFSSEYLDFKLGIPIKRNVTVYGNRNVIDGDRLAIIFNIGEGYDVVFRDIIFINANDGAIYGSCTAINCTFINNSAGGVGGAMSYSVAVNCTFINNSATNAGALSDCTAEGCIFINNSAYLGGAMVDCTALNCTFINNNASKGGAMYRGIFTNCIFKNNTAELEGNNTFETLYKSDLSVSNYSSYYNSGDKLLFSLKTLSFDPYTNATVTVRVYKNNNLIGTYQVLNDEGWVVILDAGSYTAVLSVEDQLFDVEAVNATLTISKASSKVTSQAVTTVYNGGKYLVATLKDSQGRPISGAGVSVNVNGAKTLVTDKDGQIKLSTNNLAPKKYTAKITFNGNDNYVSSETAVNVVVKKATPKITAKKKTFKKAKKVKKYKITMKVNKKAMKKVKLTLKIGKKKFTAKTNKKGKAIFKIKKLTKKGKYTAKITYKGNKCYSKVTEKVKIKLK